MRVLVTVNGLNVTMKSLPAYRYKAGKLVQEELPVTVTREQITYVMEPNGDEREVKEQEVVPRGQKRCIKEVYSNAKAEGTISVWAAESVQVEFFSFRKCGSREFYVLVIDAPAGAVAELQKALEAETKRRVEEIYDNMAGVSTRTGEETSIYVFSESTRPFVQALKEVSQGDWYINIMMQDFLGEIEGPEEYRLNLAISIKHDVDCGVTYDMDTIMRFFDVPSDVHCEKANIKKGVSVDTVEFEWMASQRFAVQARGGTTLFMGVHGLEASTPPVNSQSTRVRICDGY